jgi:hypothetical protein
VTPDALPDPIAVAIAFTGLLEWHGIPYVIGGSVRVPVSVATGTSTSPLHVDRAEMAVLRKLEWFRRGGGVSERQWRDITGSLRIQGDRLDDSILDHRAERLGLSDLLGRARDQAR